MYQLTTAQDLPSLPSLLKHIDQWIIYHASATGDVLLQPSNEDNTIRVMYDMDSFGEVDARLPAFLRQLAQDAANAGNQVIDLDISVLQDYWASSIQVIEPHYFKRPTLFRAHHVEKIVGLSESTDSDYMAVEYHHFALDATSEGGRYPVKRLHCIAQVHKDWMVANIPGWTERFPIAQSLGLDPSEMIAFLQSPVLTIGPTTLPAGDLLQVQDAAARHDSPHPAALLSSPEAHHG